MVAVVYACILIALVGVVAVLVAVLLRPRSLGPRGWVELPKEEVDEREARWWSEMLEPEEPTNPTLAEPTPVVDQPAPVQATVQPDDGENQPATSAELDAVQEYMTQVNEWMNSLNSINYMAPLLRLGRVPQVPQVLRAGGTTNWTVTTTIRRQDHESEGNVEPTKEPEPEPESDTVMSHILDRE